jgi:hypothetical protein
VSSSLTVITRMTKEEAIAAKEAEVLAYEGVVERYALRANRWEHLGRERLAELRKELADLKNNSDVADWHEALPS